MILNKYNAQQSCKQMLEDSDWTILSDVNLTEENKTEWIEWRATVRSQLIDWDENRGIPPKPEVVWAEEVPDEE